MINVVDRITGDGTFRALVARIRDSTAPGVVFADGLWGSFAPILAGTVAAQLKRPLLYVTAHLDEADEVRDDLELFCGCTPELLSAFETLPGEGAASDEIHAERIQLCAQLYEAGRNRSSTILVEDHKSATADSLRRTEAGATSSHKLEAGATFDRAMVIIATSNSGSSPRAFCRSSPPEPPNASGTPLARGSEPSDLVWPPPNSLPPSPSATPSRSFSLLPPKPQSS